MNIWQKKSFMFRRLMSKAVTVALALGAMTAVALAGPLGLPQQSKIQRGGSTPVAFFLDAAQQALIGQDFSFVIREDGIFDSNNTPWQLVSCVAFGMVQTEQGPMVAFAGFLLEPFGVYTGGVSIGYDGGFNLLMTEVELC